MFIIALLKTVIIGCAVYVRYSSCLIGDCHQVEPNLCDSSCAGESFLGCSVDCTSVIHAQTTMFCCIYIIIAYYPMSVQGSLMLVCIIRKEWGTPTGIAQQLPPPFMVPVLAGMGWLWTVWLISTWSLSVTSWCRSALWKLFVKYKKKPTDIMVSYTCLSNR